MKNIIFLVIIISAVNLHSQEKKLWAKSFIDKEAPDLVVEKWLTDTPDTKGSLNSLELNEERNNEELLGY